MASEPTVPHGLHSYTASHGLRATVSHGLRVYCYTASHGLKAYSLQWPQSLQPLMASELQSLMASELIAIQPPMASEPTASHGLRATVSHGLRAYNYTASNDIRAYSLSFPEGLLPDMLAMCCRILDASASGSTDDSGRSDSTTMAFSPWRTRA